LNIKRKFVLAIAAYAVLGLLIWQTLSDEPIRIFDHDIKLRTATLFIVGIFALRTGLHFWRVRIEESRAGIEESDESLGVSNKPM
jgi:hypothetical protein